MFSDSSACRYFLMSFCQTYMKMPSMMPATAINAVKKISQNVRLFTYSLIAASVYKPTKAVAPPKGEYGFRG